MIFKCKFLKKILLISLFPKWGSMFAEEMNDLTITLKDEFNYRYIINNPLLLWRAETLFDKEPLTITWLRSMKKGNTLFDIGANVGMYTVYAGVRGVQVFSFEPESANYFVLNRNILLNKIEKNTKAYSIALNNESALSHLKLTSSVAGSAHTTFGDNDAFKQNIMPTIFEQGAISLTLDQLVYEHHLPVPDFIKIDVDGIESKIIEGSKRLLKEEKIKSILIEINESSKEDQAIITLLQSFGFKITQKSNPITLANAKGVLSDCIFSREK